MAGTGDDHGLTPPPSAAVLTIPNALTVVRIALVPVFLWVLLGVGDEVVAFVVLAASATTDWLDGVIARRFGMVTRLGQRLDPIADRLFVLSTLVGLVLAGAAPWWLAVLVLARDLWGLVELVRLRPWGISSLPVTFIGKTATFCLLFAFPLLLLAHSGTFFSAVARPVAWAFAWWGLGLYWLSAIMYYIQAQQIVHRLAREEGE